MIRNYLSILAVALTPGLYAQGACPVIKGENTGGITVELPAASKGRFAIIALAAGRKAEPVLEEWYEPAYLRFVAKQGLFAGSHDADLWLVPVFTGLNKAAFGPSVKRLKEQADPDIARRVIFVNNDTDALLEALGIKDHDEPIFLVVDPAGNIVHREKGAFAVEKLDALEEAMDQ